MRELEEPSIILRHKRMELLRIPDMKIIVAYYEKSPNEQKNKNKNK
jgi:hypothetical protein